MTEIHWHSPDETPAEYGQWYLLTIGDPLRREVIPAIWVEDECWCSFDSFNEYGPVRGNIYSWTELPAPLIPKDKK